MGRLLVAGATSFLWCGIIGQMAVNAMFAQPVADMRFWCCLNVAADTEILTMACIAIFPVRAGRQPVGSYPPKIGVVFWGLILVAGHTIILDMARGAIGAMIALWCQLGHASMKSQPVAAMILRRSGAVISFLHMAGITSGCDRLFQFLGVTVKTPLRPRHPFTGGEGISRLQSYISVAFRTGNIFLGMDSM